MPFRILGPVDIETADGRSVSPRAQGPLAAGVPVRAPREGRPGHPEPVQPLPGPSHALRAAKAAVDQGLEADLVTGPALERRLFTGLLATEDRELGMRSYLEAGPGRAKSR